MTEFQQTIPKLVRAAAAQFGDKIAIQESDGAISYRQLDDLRVKAARAFLASGIDKGDRVAIWAPNISEWIVAAIGVHSAGGVVVPLNTRMKGSEAAYVLNASGARMLFTVKGFLDIDYPAMLGGESVPELREIVVMRGDSDGLTSWQAFLDRANAIDVAVAEVRAASVGADDTMDIMFTSGTTGQPKPAMLTQTSLLAGLTSANVGRPIEEHDRYLYPFPLFHISAHNILHQHLRLEFCLASGIKIHHICASAGVSKQK
mgnify:CR=1 FL=1